MFKAFDQNWRIVLTKLSKAMIIGAIKVASQALIRHNETGEVAEFIKKKFDKEYGGTWGCVVAPIFGCGAYVTHKGDNFIHYHRGDLHFILFKTQVLLHKIINLCSKNISKMLSNRLFRILYVFKLVYKNS